MVQQLYPDGFANSVTVSKLLKATDFISLDIIQTQTLTSIMQQISGLLTGRVDSVTIHEAFPGTPARDKQKGGSLSNISVNLDTK